MVFGGCIWRVKFRKLRPSIARVPYTTRGGAARREGCQLQPRKKMAAVPWRACQGTYRFALLKEEVSVNTPGEHFTCRRIVSCARVALSAAASTSRKRLLSAPQYPLDWGTAVAHQRRELVLRPERVGWARRGEAAPRVCRRTCVSLLPRNICRAVTHPRLRGENLFFARSRGELLKKLRKKTSRRMVRAPPIPIFLDCPAARHARTDSPVSFFPLSNAVHREGTAGSWLPSSPLPAVRCNPEDREKSREFFFFKKYAVCHDGNWDYRSRENNTFIPSNSRILLFLPLLNLLKKNKKSTLANWRI